MNAKLWQPGAERVERSNLQRFMQLAGERAGRPFVDYDDFYRWSVEQPEAFWSLMWDFGGVRASARGDEVLVDGDRMPGARWFPGARLNYAENLLRNRDDWPALVFRNEAGRRDSLSFAGLYRRVAQLAAGLRRAGVGEGDVVAGFVPNVIDTVVAMLATASIGGVWTSCSPDFGSQGILDRFGQTKPKVLFTTDGYLYNGKSFDSLEKLAAVLPQLPDIERLVVMPYLQPEPDLSQLPGAVLLDDFADSSATDIEFAQLAFDSPLFILYSSGTTGAPKCIVHSVGGALLQHLKEHQLHTDLKREDMLFYYTTCGWMMWNWMVSALATGSSLVLFDGSPFAPHASVLWDIVDEEGVTVFGTSAKYIAAQEKAGIRPRLSHRLDTLRTILSTGSALTHESFEYVYREVKADLCLSSISGGTDILSCFALGNPILPVHAGELQCRGLGMAVEIWGDDGQPVGAGRGELVCTRPFPAMPIGFWNDPGDRKFREAYFSTFDNVWAHGDYAELMPGGGVVIHGRSDAVLNPGGVRIGTAEIYRQVEKVEAVEEAVTIGQSWDDDVRVVLFVRLREGTTLDEALEQEIRQTIRRNTTPRHVPAKIIQVADIPRTRTGKIVELAVRNVVEGKPVKNREALANPEALELYRDLPQLM
ncbi:acetoacetyl-CoA synthetase [Marinobacterium nitratireducens]|uniref:Acetoacetyl-CoA synthetase n=1 Tax=Marinobacterium nitratireducens TaxID=518897 RepID=A0A917ZM51_9GAMM|nr:acetoacetate--CoA ligase [Marinobacterium nitratireducens]GGO85238.1 acetoacetyl-CoA synthetase [Marinobacterium nitratireducens]